MKKLKVLHKILKTTNAMNILYGFFVYFVISATIILRVEPNINRIKDSIWFCFASVTTIGYGDFTVVTNIGRIVTALLSIYGIVVISILTGTIVSFINEIQKIPTNESIVDFLTKLENLENMSKEELRELSQKIKENKYRM